MKGHVINNEKRNTGLNYSQNILPQPERLRMT